jgi:glutamine amidotransferase
MIGVIDYGAGNIRSASKGLNAAGAEVIVAERGEDLTNVDAIVLPGVGHAGQLMKALEDRGFDRAIRDAVAAGRPFLGICVGLQIMYGSQEEGDGFGLGLLPGRVAHLPRTLKTPHMGWSQVEAVQDSPFGAIGAHDYYYFVHSYAAEMSDSTAIVGTTTYGVTFPAVVIQNHLWGCQFHPEKSADAGIRFLSAFADFVAMKSTVPLGAATA